MLKFEVFTQNSYDANVIAGLFNGDIHAYNITSDEEYFMVTFTSWLSHSNVVQLLAGYEWEEIISSEI
jgi:hypothetical protein|nr:MAG TPA: hypothetical protein [Caudoviricetes sp.]